MGPTRVRRFRVMVTSQVLASIGGGPVSDRYSLLVTQDRADVRAAQRLRFDVFAGEQGARLQPGPAAAGLDVDAFDEHCEHLVIREDSTGVIVGTYRMLTPQGAQRAGGLYCDTEFDLGALEELRSQTLEVGRSCIHPEHRSGAVLSLIWAGIGRYLLLNGYRWVIGCASVALSEHGAMPAPVWSLVRERHLAPPQRRVLPRRPAPLDRDEAGRAARASLPPLLRGYLQLGAEIGGPPALDPDFGVADLLVLLDYTAVDPRWRRHLLGDPQ